MGGITCPTVRVTGAWDAGLLYNPSHAILLLPTAKQSHLPVLQGPVTTLTELPWSESQVQHSTIVTLPQDRCVRLRVASIAFVRGVHVCDELQVFLNSIDQKGDRLPFSLNHLSQYQSHSYKPADIPEGISV
jgi:hypothetical protein